MRMLSNKSYLVRAFFDWIVDSKATPLLVVDATYPRCNVPREYVENGEIILNICPNAIRDLKISYNLVEFKASFSGIAHLISIPIKAVLAIYAEENGQGMFFDSEEDNTEDESSWENTGEDILSEPENINKKKSHLKLVE